MALARESLNSNCTNIMHSSSLKVKNYHLFNVFPLTNIFLQAFVLSQVTASMLAINEKLITIFLSHVTMKQFQHSKSICQENESKKFPIITFYLK